LLVGLAALLALAAVAAVELVMVLLRKAAPVVLAA
jgi:hypothetical protein